LIVGLIINAAPSSRKVRRVMNDVIFVGAIVAFFFVSVLYVRFCDKL
jgi:hypothetical protein